MMAADVIIDWSNTAVRITLTGRSIWRRGQSLGWRQTIDDHDLWYVFCGKGELRTASDRPLPLVTGACLWLTPGCVFEGRQDPADPVGNYYVHFNLYDLKGRLRPYTAPRPPEQLEAGDGIVVGAVLRRITELLPFWSSESSQQTAPETIRTAEALLCGILMDLDQASTTDTRGTLAGTRRHHGEVVMRAVAQIQDPAGLQPPTVSELAETAGYSPEHFSRIFRSLMRQSPEQFIVESRIEQAKRLLRSSPMSIKEIGRTLGYRHPTFFSEQFRRRTGQSPRSYRDAGAEPSPRPAGKRRQ